MSLFWLAFSVVVLFAIAYVTYGRFLSRHLDLRLDRKTPACEINDGMDFVPTSAGFLLGQHFSAIAAAGPIVGPILAGLWFGWLPVILWIIGGAIFFGAVHDFSSLVGSVRHRAESIVEIVKDILGPRGHLFFLIFVWLSLLYVIIAFTDLTSASFVDPELGGGVATSSILYLILGLLMGISLHRFKLPLLPATILFISLVVLAILAGPLIPTVIPGSSLFTNQQIWNVILLAYCFAASIIPVWLLLQPRGYLGGFFLYITLAAGLIGLFLGGEKISYPAFIGFHNAQGVPLFPFLFVTVACGACSGFHGIVSSGTTSKQVAKETDCRMVGYGGMLLEGLVALIALSTVMILSRSDTLTGSSPDRIYADGLARFVQNFGISRDFARAFTLLAFTTFIYDTLDVSTRLARYIFQELTGLKGASGRIISTLASLAIPLICVSWKITDAQGYVVPAWKVFWTIFGTSNQLLAALTLMSLSLWFKRTGRSWWIGGIPMIFMMTMTLWSLSHMIFSTVGKLLAPVPRLDITGIVAFILFGLAVLLMAEALRSQATKPAPVKTLFEEGLDD